MTFVRKFLRGAPLAGVLMAAPLPALPQPEPSFRATCGELRAASRALEGREEELVTIQVVGPLREVRSDGALAYMLMCEPPDPQVLCVTYETGGRKRGDRVVLTGSYSRRGPDHILLDPCLHGPE
jgi:hypothetical protein